MALVAAAPTQEEAAAALADLPPLPADAPSAARPAVPAGAAATATPMLRSPDWRPTAERFRDPRTRRVMRVWEDAGGGRHYVADDEPGLTSPTTTRPDAVPHTGAAPEPTVKTRRSRG